MRAGVRSGRTSFVEIAHHGTAKPTERASKRITELHAASHTGWYRDADGFPEHSPALHGACPAEDNSGVWEAPPCTFKESFSPCAFTLCTGDLRIAQSRIYTADIMAAFNTSLQEGLCLFCSQSHWQCLDRCRAHTTWQNKRAQTLTAHEAAFQWEWKDVLTSVGRRRARKTSCTNWDCFTSLPRAACEFYSPKALLPAPGCPQ